LGLVGRRGGNVGDALKRFVDSRLVDWQGRDDDSGERICVRVVNVDTPEQGKLCNAALFYAATDEGGEWEDGAVEALAGVPRLMVWVGPGEEDDALTAEAVGESEIHNDSCVIRHRDPCDVVGLERGLEGAVASLIEWRVPSLKLVRVPMHWVAIHVIRSTVFRHDAKDTYVHVMRNLDGHCVRVLKKMAKGLKRHSVFPAREFVSNGAVQRYYGRDPLPLKWSDRNQEAANQFREMRLLRRGLSPSETLMSFLKSLRVNPTVKGAAMVRVSDLLGREGGPLWGRAFSEACKVWEAEEAEYKCFFLRPGWEEEVVKDLGAEDSFQEYKDERVEEEEEMARIMDEEGIVVWREDDDTGEEDGRELDGVEPGVQPLVEEEEQEDDDDRSMMLMPPPLPVVHTTKRLREEGGGREEPKKTRTLLLGEIIEEKSKSEEWSARLKRILEG